MVAWTTARSVRHQGFCIKDLAQATILLQLDLSLPDRLQPAILPDRVYFVSTGDPGN